MKKLNIWLPLVAIMTFVFALNPTSYACGNPPPIQPPKVWVISHGDTNNDGLFEWWIGIELDSVFAPINPATSCVCGLGLNGNLPPIAILAGAMIAVTNTVTHEITPLPEFVFLRDPNLDDPLKAGDALPLGAQWAGFQAFVNPFVLPPLGPNEVYKLWFEVLFDVPVFPPIAVQVAAGSPGDSDHPIIYTIDPVIASLLLEKPHVKQTFTGIPENEGRVQLFHSISGLKKLVVRVNDYPKIELRGLSDNEGNTIDASIDISHYMMQGNNNTIRVDAFGKKGGEATLTIGE